MSKLPRRSVSSPSTIIQFEASTSSNFVPTNISNNDEEMVQKMEALESLLMKVVDENDAMKTTMEEIKAEIIQVKEMKDKSNQKLFELEAILKPRRQKIHTGVVFHITPEMLAENIQVRLSSEVATFSLKHYINFDMEDNALEEVAKSIAIRMFEQLIPNGCTLANFSTSSSPKNGYITIRNNLFDELAEKLVQFTQGHKDHNLKRALLIRINYGLEDKIKRARKRKNKTEALTTSQINDIINMFS